MKVKYMVNKHDYSSIKQKKIEKKIIFLFFLVNLGIIFINNNLINYKYFILIKRLNY